MMTEFSFGLFITLCLRNSFLNFLHEKTMAYWFAIHFGNVLARPLILVTYSGIHVEMEKREGGPGGGAPNKLFTSHALQIAGKYLLSSVNYSRLFRKLTANEKYNVCLKVISGYFKYKMASARV